jgi:hypothetical protein
MQGCPNLDGVASLVIRAKYTAANEYGATAMDDIKANAAKHHEDAAHHLETAAKMHRDAAKQCLSGNFAKAQSLGTSAAETDTVANRHATEAADLYRHHDEEVAGHKAEVAAEEAIRSAKHDAKAAEA